MEKGFLMHSFFAQSAAWQLIKQADFLSKLVLLTLLFMSIVCIAVIIHKFLSFKKEQVIADTLMKKLRGVKLLGDIVSLSREYKDCFIGSLLSSQLQELRAFIELSRKRPVDILGNVDVVHDSQVVLTIHDIEHLSVFSNQEVTSIITQEESLIHILSSSAAVAPLIGLFGTVWGLIHAFINISQEHSADIATVAPGIAEALITTLAGVFVAIPATIAFHYFAQKIRMLELRLFDASDLFLAISKKNFLKL